MWLVRGYKATGEIGKALIICQRLMLSEHQKVSDWAGKMYQKLNESPLPEAETETETETETAENPVANKKAVGAAGVKLAMAGIGGNLALASAVTMSLMSGMVLVLALGIVFIADSENPILGLGIALSEAHRRYRNYCTLQYCCFFLISIFNGFNPKLVVQNPLG
ncbi:MAG: hypothetical protein AAGM40_05545 [Cyanobacteria bacterium J06573_2]